MKVIRSLVSALFVAGILFTSTAMAEQPWLKPYTLTSNAKGTVAEQVKVTQAALQGAGFEIAGTYQPYPSAAVISVTNDNLKGAAAKTEFGGYGAVIRVALTQAGENVQVSYMNPEWMKASFRMKGDLSATSAALTKALGKGKIFGAEDPGWKADQLAEFHFTIFMPYFDDPFELVSHGSYEAAIKKVEAGLAAGKGGTAKIFRVDIPGKKQTLYGVALDKTSGSAGDQHIMSRIDNTDLKQTAHLPYGLLVSGNNVYALHAKFRIANSFPDLTMGTFFKIEDAPDAIEKALATAAGG